MCHMCASSQRVRIRTCHRIRKPHVKGTQATEQGEEGSTHGFAWHLCRSISFVHDASWSVAWIAISTSSTLCRSLTAKLGTIVPVYARPAIRRSTDRVSIWSTPTKRHFGYTGSHYAAQTRSSHIPTSRLFLPASISVAQAYRYYQSLALSPAPLNVMPNVPAEYFSGPLSAPLMPHPGSGPFFALAQPSTPGPHPEHQPMMVSSPHIVDLMGLSTGASMPTIPSGRASATEADFDLGMVDLTGLPTVVPTSAHVRPVDLPAPQWAL